MGTTSPGVNFVRRQRNITLTVVGLLIVGLCVGAYFGITSRSDRSTGTLFPKNVEKDRMERVGTVVSVTPSGTTPQQSKDTSKVTHFLPYLPVPAIDIYPVDDKKQRGHCNDGCRDYYFVRSAEGTLVQEARPMRRWTTEIVRSWQHPQQLYDIEVSYTNDADEQVTFTEQVAVPFAEGERLPPDKIVLTGGEIEPGSERPVYYARSDSAAFLGGIFAALFVVPGLILFFYLAVEVFPNHIEKADDAAEASSERRRGGFDSNFIDLSGPSRSDSDSNSSNV